jgi:YVTN family beta-propeller protein
MYLKRSLLILSIVSFSAVTTPALRAQEASTEPTSSQFTPYKLLKKTVIGGEGGWDFLTCDPLNRRLYISHGTQVDVYNMKTDSVVGHILHTEGVHGIAIVDREHHGFITCGRSNSVLMFDLKTLDTLMRIPVGGNPDAIIFDPQTWRVFVMNAKTENISVLDAASGKVIATIKLPGAPEFAVSDHHGHIYVNLEEQNEVVKIDSREDTIMAVWPLAPGEGPTGIAMDRASKRLFIGCANEKMIVVDVVNGKVVTTLPIGKGVDAVEYDPWPKLAFSSNGEGNVTIVREAGSENFQVVQTLQTERGARTLALDPRTHNIYLPTAEFGPPPAPTPEHPKPRPSILPGTFMILKYGPEVK